MQFIKTRPVKDPVRNAAENAGIDFYIPENNLQLQDDMADKNSRILFTDGDTASIGFILHHSSLKTNLFDVKTGLIYIAPHSDILIPSGIKSKFTNNIALIANNKSGVATKKKLVFGASVIDASYQGEWHLHLINTSDEYQTIACGTKIIQFIPHYICTDDIEICSCSEQEFFTETTSRGAKGFGEGTGIK